ncbi:hypothetical protein BC938DRAFT_480727 [Jimgerdemannia flammicorona]|uniref:Uncharacterized protein n=1 Tax=Jimgerdemannia flammicorona TaxID=994334 RepID=A0A433QIK3_9FUNG|nr:hypothetical protein BC938DRAFT_480727 [Jimgerdemannia flammicorona]
MDISNTIARYLNDVAFSKWSVTGCLEFLTERNTWANERLLNIKTNLYGSEVKVQVIGDKLATLCPAASSASNPATIPVAEDAVSLVTPSASNSATTLVDSGSPEKRKREEDDNMLLPSVQEFAMDIFGNEVECSETMRAICSEHMKYHPADDVIDTAKIVILQATMKPSRRSISYGNRGENGEFDS